ncbi:MAG: hypothetical protein LQ340_001868, partial [Diploschistes diacapsis]
RAGEEGWDGEEYLPQGTVGCVALDDKGVICVATSTGGLTNKLQGRIGDTPTFGAGFWAEEIPLQMGPSSSTLASQLLPRLPALQSLAGLLPRSVTSALNSCLPSLDGYSSLAQRNPALQLSKSNKDPSVSFTHALALSGTGNGDSFLRLAACRTAASIALPPLSYFPAASIQPHTSLSTAINLVAGPGGLLQRSAGNRWKRGTFEGEGGMIGIEYVRNGSKYEEGERRVAFGFNCGGMFRAWVDDGGRIMVGIFRCDDEEV